VLSAGCNERSALPTSPWPPAQDDAPTDGWTQLYPATTLRDLRTVFALDSDEAWAAGDAGLVVQFDGEQARVHRPTSGTIDVIDGHARDDVWALTSHQLLHWDGRQWREARDTGWSEWFQALHCDGDGTTWLGQRGTRVVEVDGEYRSWRVPVISDLAREWVIPRQDADVERIWRPHADGPLLAAIADSVATIYALQDGQWEPLAWDLAQFQGADGPTLCAATRAEPSRRDLFTITPNLELALVCEDLGGSILAHSRAVLLASGNEIRGVSSCVRFDVLDGARSSVRAMAVPRRAGPAGPVVFAVGYDGLFLRGAWREDWSMEWAEVTPGPHAACGGVTSAGGLLFSASWDDGVLVSDHDRWWVEDVGFRIARIAAGHDGRLLAWSWWGDVARREADGQWQRLPMFPGEYPTIMADAGGRVYARAEWSTTIQVLDGDHWRPLDPTGGSILFGYLGVAPTGDLYQLVRLHRLGQFVLHHDGERWHDVTPPDTELSWSQFAVSAVDGRLSGFLRRRTVDGAAYDVFATLVDGTWQDEGPLDINGDAPDRNIIHAADGTFYATDSSRIFRHTTDQTWEVVCEVPGGIDAVVVEPDHGIFVESESRILHHPLTAR
jgi:hypothetical protein